VGSCGSKILGSSGSVGSVPPAEVVEDVVGVPELPPAEVPPSLVFDVVVEAVPPAPVPPAEELPPELAESDALFESEEPPQAVKSKSQPTRHDDAKPQCSVCDKRHHPF